MKKKVNNTNIRTMNFFAVMVILVEENKIFFSNFLIVPAIYGITIQFIKGTTSVYLLILFTYILLFSILIEYIFRYIKRKYNKKIKIYNKVYIYAFVVIFSLSILLTTKRFGSATYDIYLVLLLILYASLSFIMVYIYSFKTIGVKFNSMLEDYAKIGCKRWLYEYTFGFLIGSASIIVFSFLSNITILSVLILFIFFLSGTMLFILSLSEIINYYLYKILKELNKSIEEKEEIKT